ncbi:hypothetical protein AQI95_05885 [Streptomyces yokosukanensis]|uniref:Uncharacterized protein n=1 Tax=Streptomyces yokosukanensis TaxID=67386 RepID=A0A101PDD0_9ACTN|nr:hypothetical protein [Streptomyces yokosukanensis]KUN09347.1 hypothetical protein AQI95_05885 [Streptomyces yokosukanensis]
MHDIGARARVGDHTYGLSSVDRRQVPVEAWLRHLITATDVPAPSGPSGFWRTAFDQAVRDQAVREQAVRDALPH